MSVLDRTYRRWRGTPTSYTRRLLVIPRFAVADVLSRKLTVAVWIASLLPPVVLVLMIYVSANLPALRASLPQLSDLPRVDLVGPGVFAAFTAIQLHAATVLSLFVGPRLIAQDIAGGALPLYFSKALRRWDYLLGKCLVLFGVLSTVTWMPLLLAHGLRWSLSPETRGTETWLAGAILVVGTTYCALLTMLLGAVSTHVRRTWLAPFMLLALLVTVGAVGGIIDVATGTWVGSAVSPVRAVERLHAWAFTPPDQPAPVTGPWTRPLLPPAVAALSALAWTAASAALLARKTRPVEVVG